MSKAKPEFLQFLIDTYEDYRINPQGQRLGQYFFNAVHAVNPDVANLYRGTLYDPFYHDEILGDFLHKVSDKW